MKLIDKIKAVSDLKDYGISKTLRSKGVEVTPQGIGAYSSPKARSMRLDVLCGLRKISKLSWADFGRWLDEEFYNKSQEK